MQFEIQGALAKPLEVNHGFRLDQHKLVAGGSFTEELQHDSRVSPIGHTDWQLPATLRLGERPVDHLAGNEIGVGDDDFRTLKCLDGAGANADAHDFTGGAVDLENVVDVDRPLELQDQA